MKTSYQDLESVVRANEAASSDLEVQMIKMEAIQGGVSRLMDRIDEITYKGWDKEQAMAYLSIEEIKDTVRLLDMAFQPLFKSVSESVNEIRTSSLELHEKVVAGHVD